MRYDVVCEATVGTSSSSAGTIAFLDALFAGGHISLKTYVKYYPEDALTNKSEILAEVESMEAEAMAQVQSELAMVQAELQRCQAAMAEDAALAERAASIVKNNQQLGLMLAALYAESKEKLNAANASIKAGNARIDEVTKDATDFAVALDQMQNAG